VVVPSPTNEFSHAIFALAGLDSLPTYQLSTQTRPLLLSSTTQQKSIWCLELSRSHCALAMDANIGDPRLAPSVERAFEGQPEPRFWEQVTLRAMLVSAVLGVVFCFITLRIHMTAGIVPAFNMPTTVLSFFFLKWIDSLSRSCGMVNLPFTRQENIFVITAINNCINVALTGSIPGPGNS
jgi:hypothetical protein